jgi:hypothetical protein
MPAKQSRPRSTDKRLALDKRLGEIRAELAKLKRDRAAVRRDEFAEMSKALEQLHKNTDDLATQLTRIAQIQQEVDAIKRASQKAKLLN